MKPRHLLYLGSLAFVLASPAQAEVDITPALWSSVEKPGSVEMPADQPVTGNLGQTRGAEARQAVRCYQRGVRVLDEELGGVLSDAQLRASTLLLRQASGQRLAIVTAGEGLCVLTLPPEAPPGRPTSTPR